MPGQRKKSKKLVSGYVDESLKQAIDNLPQQYSETVFVELSIIRGLLRDKAITKAQLRELAEGKHLNTETIKTLRSERVI